MWFRKAEEVATMVMDRPVPVERPKPAPLPVPTPVELKKDLPEGYIEACDKIGCFPTLRIEQTIADLGLHVYPMDKVCAYLNQKFEKTGWVWVPLRKQDIIVDRSFNDTNQRIYTKAIPFPVIQSIEKLTTAHPKLCFFVSDERQKSDEKDPFLLVTMKNSSHYWVVERWDEPSFRG